MTTRAPPDRGLRRAFPTLNPQGEVDMRLQMIIGALGAAAAMPALA